MRVLEHDREVVRVDAVEHASVDRAVVELHFDSFALRAAADTKQSAIRRCTTRRAQDRVEPRQARSCEMDAPRRSGMQRARGGEARAAAGLRHEQERPGRCVGQRLVSWFSRASDRVTTSSNAPLNPSVGCLGAANPGGAAAVAGADASFPFVLLLLSVGLLVSIHTSTCINIEREMRCRRVSIVTCAATWQHLHRFKHDERQQ